MITNVIAAIGILLIVLGLVQSNQTYLIVGVVLLILGLLL